LQTIGKQGLDRVHTGLHLLSFAFTIAMRIKQDYLDRGWEKSETEPSYHKGYI
jgi:hypothetical protein